MSNMQYAWQTFKNRWVHSQCVCAASHTFAPKYINASREYFRVEFLAILSSNIYGEILLKYSMTANNAVLNK